MAPAALMGLLKMNEGLEEQLTQTDQMHIPYQVTSYFAI